ncbi:MAG: hypothetical protein M1815_002699 [Lichina confinis]|nr:MAG: hypothetical protein M1815_002699 [Lichina confinis]
MTNPAKGLAFARKSIKPNARGAPLDYRRASKSASNGSAVWHGSPVLNRGTVVDVDVDVDGRACGRAGSTSATPQSDGSTAPYLVTLVPSYVGGLATVPSRETKQTGAGAPRQTKARDQLRQSKPAPYITRTKPVDIADDLRRGSAFAQDQARFVVTVPLSATPPPGSASSLRLTPCGVVITILAVEGTPDSLSFSPCELPSRPRPTPLARHTPPSYPEIVLLGPEGGGQTVIRTSHTPSTSSSPAGHRPSSRLLHPHRPLAGRLRRSTTHVACCTDRGSRTARNQRRARRQQLLLLRRQFPRTGTCLLPTESVIPDRPADTTPDDDLTQLLQTKRLALSVDGLSLRTDGRSRHRDPATFFEGHRPCSIQGVACQKGPDFFPQDQRRRRFAVQARLRLQPGHSFAPAVRRICLGQENSQAACPAPRATELVPTLWRPFSDVASWARPRWTGNRSVSVLPETEKKKDGQKKEASVGPCVDQNMGPALQQQDVQVHHVG